MAELLSLGSGCFDQIPHTEVRGHVVTRTDGEESPSQAPACDEPQLRLHQEAACPTAPPARNLTAMTFFFPHARSYSSNDGTLT
jgi:hypothetical protein